MTGAAAVGAWGAAFVATHLLMSHPLRAPIAAKTGPRGFVILYSLVSLVTFVGMVMARLSIIAAAVIAGFVAGAAQPYLFKNLRYV